MNSKEQEGPGAPGAWDGSPGTLVRASGAVASGLLLVVVPLVSHWKWGRGELAFHGVPAFFLALVAWIAGWGLVGVLGQVRRRGLRGLASRGSLRRLAACLALGISAVALFYAVEGWRGRRAWAQVAAEAAARGASLDARDLAPRPGPEAEDFGQDPLFAPLWAPRSRELVDAAQPGDEGDLGLLRRVGGRMLAVGGRLQPAWLTGSTQDLKAWLPVFRPVSPPRYRVRLVDGEVKGRFERDPAPDTSRPVAEELGRELADVGRVLDRVREAAGRPHCRLPYDSSSAMLDVDPGVRVLLGLQVAAAVRSGVAVVERREAEALRDLELSLRLAGHVEAQPGLFSQLARSQALAHTLQPLWEGLRLGMWDETGLARVQALLEALRPAEGISRHRRAVALAVADFVESVVPTGRFAASEWGGLSEDDRRVLAWVRGLYPSGWSALSQAATLRVWLRGVERQGLAPGEGGDADRRALLRGTSDPVFPVFVAPKVVAMWEDGREGALRAEALARIGEVACAVTRRERSGAGLPATLDELVPRWLSRVPRDPADGGVLRYRRGEGGRFRVVSAGADGREGGGEPPRDVTTGGGGVLGAEAGGDWVWLGGR